MKGRFSFRKQNALSFNRVCHNNSGIFWSVVCFLTCIQQNIYIMSINFNNMLIIT